MIPARQLMAIAVTAVLAGSVGACDSGESERPTTQAETTSSSPVPTAPPTTPRFSVARMGVELAAECRPGPVRQLVVTMLTAFNQGDGAGFAAGFEKPIFHPYSFRIAGSGFTDRESIVSFVAERHQAGDGWSALRLLPPRGRSGSRDEATYGLALRVSQRGELVRRSGAKLIVDCRSGLLVTWVGPGYGPDDVRARQT
jgi:hypothetical protein